MTILLYKSRFITSFGANYKRIKVNDPTLDIKVDGPP